MNMLMEKHPQIQLRDFCSILKRSIIRINYYTSNKKHLQKYVDEFVFRYSQEIIKK